MFSVGESVRDVSSGGFRRTHDLHDLAPLNTVVTSDGVLYLNLWQLSLLDSVLLEQLVLLLVGEHLMLGHQLMLSDIDQQLCLIKELYFTRLHVLEILYKLIKSRKRGILCEKLVCFP